MRKLVALTMVALLVSAAGADVFSAAGPGYGGSRVGPDIDEYRYDDGTAENSLGLTAGGELAWMHMFDTKPIGSLTHVNAAIGRPGGSHAPLKGTTMRVFVWDDPTNDWNPADAVLIGKGSGTITNVDDNVLNRIKLDAPVPTNKLFMIGVAVKHPRGMFPASMDQTTPYVKNHAWVAGDTGGNFDPNNLGGGIGLFEMSAIGFPYHFLLTGTIPEPATLGLLVLGAVGLLRRR